ncbi:MAG: hypothetical protein JWN34_6361 [Bryobacterales bacterium]|nr:hypothetical protein [Bryobacterales bacterium]
MMLSKGRVNSLNAVPSVLWSVLCLGPLAVFCYEHMERPWIYGFTVTSLLTYALPVSVLRYFELGSRPASYRAREVHLVIHVTQDSPFIKRLAGGMQARRVRLSDRAALSRLRAVTYARERFHWTMLVFFLLTSLYAVFFGHWAWALLIAVANVIYNVYPIWLQQYIRLRLQRILK